MNTNKKTNTETIAFEKLKKTWLAGFVFVLMVVAVGGCLVVENKTLTLLEMSIGSFLIALFVVETAAIIIYFTKKPTFVLTAYLLAKAFNLPYGKSQASDVSKNLK